MKCGARPLRPLPARPDARSAATARSSPTTPRAPWLRGAGAVSAREAEARRLEVRLVRRLPALAARLRGRAARARRRGRDRVLPRGDERHRRRARTTSRSSRARSRPRTTPSGSSEVRAASKALVTIGACATAGGIQALRNFADVDGVRRAIVYASPEYISTLATSTPIAAPRPGRLRAARLPDRQAAAARGRHGLPARPPAGHPVDERLHRVQAARHRLRHGRARDAVPRPGHARRLRRALPGLRPRLLRLLRPDGDAEHRLADAAAAACSAWTTADVERVFRTFNADAPAFREAAERVAERRDDQDRLPRARRGRGRDVRARSATATSSTSSCGSSSRRASSRRSSAAAPSPRRRTSPRASAASARSRTR